MKLRIKRDYRLEQQANKLLRIRHKSKKRKNKNIKKEKFYFVDEVKAMYKDFHYKLKHG